MSTKNNIFLTLAAITTGAALGLLFAPASGKDTRENIARKATKMRKGLSDTMEDGRDIVNKVKSEAGDLAEKARDTMNSSKEHAKEAASATASTARSAANGGYKS